MDSSGRLVRVIVFAVSLVLLVALASVPLATHVLCGETASSQDTIPLATPILPDDRAFKQNPSNIFLDTYYSFPRITIAVIAGSAFLVLAVAVAVIIWCLVFMKRSVFIIPSQPPQPSPEPSPQPPSRRSELVQELISNLFSIGIVWPISIIISALMVFASCKLTKRRSLTIYFQWSDLLRQSGGPYRRPQAALTLAIFFSSFIYLTSLGAPYVLASHERTFAMVRWIAFAISTVAVFTTYTIVRLSVRLTPSTNSIIRPLFGYSVMVLFAAGIPAIAIGFGLAPATLAVCIAVSIVTVMSPPEDARAEHDDQEIPDVRELYENEEGRT